MTNPKWRDAYKREESRLGLTLGEIVVHRYRDEEPDQWLYSCHRLGQECVRIGNRGDSMDEAKANAIAVLAGVLDAALAELRKVPAKTKK